MCHYWIKLKIVMLNEITEALKCKFCVLSHNTGLKRVDLLEAESRIVVTSGWREYKRRRMGKVDQCVLSHC